MRNLVLQYAPFECNTDVNADMIVLLLWNCYTSMRGGRNASCSRFHSLSRELDPTKIIVPFYSRKMQDCLAYQGLLTSIR